MKERDTFEADYFAGLPLNVSGRERSGDGYKYSNVQVAWSLWQSAWSAAREAVVEEMCTRIKAADDAAADSDYMLDSDDCIAVLRGAWKEPIANDCPPKPPHSGSREGAGG